jgi:hypothetical protein
MDTLSIKIQSEKRSMAGSSRTGSTEGSEYGVLRCSEAQEGATGRDPGYVNLESVTENVESLGLQRPKRIRVAR